MTDINRGIGRAVRLDDYALRFMASDSLADDGDPGKFPLAIDGTLQYLAAGDGHWSDADPDEDAHAAGRVTAYYLPVTRVLAAGNCTLEDMFEDASEEIQAAFHALYETSTAGTTTFSRAVREMFPYELLSLDLLYIQRLDILPAHRGNGLGLAIVRRVIQRFGPVQGLVATMPAPRNPGGTPWDEAMEFNAIPAHVGLARGKLQRYFRALGLERVGDSDIFALSTARVLPDIATLCPNLVG